MLKAQLSLCKRTVTEQQASNYIKLPGQATYHVKPWQDSHSARVNVLPRHRGRQQCRGAGWRHSRSAVGRNLRACLPRTSASARMTNEWPPPHPSSSLPKRLSVKKQVLGEGKGQRAHRDSHEPTSLYPGGPRREKPGAMTWQVQRPNNTLASCHAFLKHNTLAQVHHYKRKYYN